MWHHLTTVHEFIRAYQNRGLDGDLDEDLIFFMKFQQSLETGFNTDKPISNSLSKLIPVSWSSLMPSLERVGTPKFLVCSHHHLGRVSVRSRTWVTINFLVCHDSLWTILTSLAQAQTWAAGIWICPYPRPELHILAPSLAYLHCVSNHPSLLHSLLSISVRATYADALHLSGAMAKGDPKSIYRTS
jgi:hypothetical protein